MFPPHLADKLRTLLEQFLVQEPGSAVAIRGFLSPVVARYCSHHASTLPVDLREDVVQETLLMLVGSGQGTYNGATNTSAGFVYNTVRSALQSVRRRHGIARQQSEVSEYVDLETLPIGHDVEDRQYATIMAHKVLESLEPRFAQLLWRVYARGESQEVVLAGTGMSRYAFDRQRKSVAQAFAGLTKCA